MKFPANVIVITDEVSQDLPEIARFVREFGLPGIELRSMFGRAFKDLTPADRAEIKRVAQGEGWKIFGCASPVFKSDIDDAATTRAHLEEFKRSLGVAHELGCDLVRVFTFLRRPPAENAALLPRVVSHLAELQRLAAGSNVRIGIENEHSCVVGTAEECAALLALIPDPRLGIVWDPCNPLYVPGVTGDVTRGFATIASRVHHIHVKDARRRAPAPNTLPAEATPIGDGDVGWKAHLAEIRRVGYRGLLSLETHWRVRALDEASLHLPAGYGFSAGGEEASRICLQKLQALMA